MGTIEDGSTLSPNSLVEKTWVLRVAQGEVKPGTMLVHVGGAVLDLETDKTVIVDEAAVTAGKELPISVKFKTPQSAGRYVSFFRFMTAEGAYFGPSLWVDFTIDEADSSDASETSDASEDAAQGGAAKTEAETETETEAETAEAKVEETPLETQAQKTAADIAHPLVQQLLSAIDVAPDGAKPRLSSMLFNALGSNDASALLTELAKLNIQLQ